MSSKRGDEQHGGKDDALLQELIEISNKHSPYRGDGGDEVSNKAKKKPRIAQRGSCSANEKENSENGLAETPQESDDFLSKTGEKRNLNQYWYSRKTIEVLCDAIREGLGSEGRRVAFLSTPSLFFSLPPKEREDCALFDVSFDDVGAPRVSSKMNFTTRANLTPPSPLLPLRSSTRRGNPPRATTFTITTTQRTSKRAAAVHST